MKILFTNYDANKRSFAFCRSTLQIPVNVNHNNPSGAETVVDAMIAIINSPGGNGEVILKNITTSTSPSEKFIQSLDERIEDLGFVQPRDYSLPSIGHTFNEQTLTVHPQRQKLLHCCFKEGRIWSAKWGKAYIMYTGSVRPIRKTDDVICILNRKQPSKIPPLPNATSYVEGAVIPLEEGLSVEFKQFAGQDVDKQIVKEVSKYASGFANTVGGRIIFGVDDKSRKICGVKLQKDSLTLSNEIEQKLKQLTWIQVKAGTLQKLKQEDIRRDIQFSFETFNFKVTEKNGQITDRCVFVLTVDRLPRGMVFTKPPTCPYYDGYDVRQALVGEWCALANNCLSVECRP